MDSENRTGTSPSRQPDVTLERRRALFARRRVSRALASALKAARRRRRLLLGIALLPLALLAIPMLWLVHHVYFDHDDLPDLDAFVRFEPPTTGIVTDARGNVLIELAHQYREVVSYDQVPAIMRQAVLAAEDKRFFSHSGVDYRALPRVIEKSVSRSLSGWWHGNRPLRLLLPQGGSTLTQQLVRGYFLHKLTSRGNGDTAFHSGLAPPRLLSTLLGAPATNKLLRKLEEVRLTLWIEREMGRRYGSQEQAKREIFARYASFIYLGSGRYGFAAAAEYYFHRPLASFTAEDAGDAALLAAIGKSPRNYAPEPGNRRLLERRNQILGLMARDGYIPASLAQRCRKEPIRLASHGPVKTAAPAVIDHVFEELARRGGGCCSVEDLFQGRFSVETTVDARVQAIVNESLESGLTRYETRHPKGKGVIQGSVVVLRNADSAILAEAGGRQHYRDREARYSDFNRVTDSLRQPGSAMKPLVYLAAFESGLTLDTEVPDEPISVPLDGSGKVKWIANYDRRFEGPIPIRQALAESRNTVAVWLTREIGVGNVIQTASAMGIRTRLKHFLSTGLGASEVHLLELANAYRAIASGVLARPHVIARVTDDSGDRLYEAPPPDRTIHSDALVEIQEGLRGVVRLPGGTAHALDSRSFPIPVMGKTGTTSDFRDALFVGSTFGPAGITVAVRVGFDDDRSLGAKETGARTALPIFREVMLRVYQEDLVGKAPHFPDEIETGIDRYLAQQLRTASAPKELPAPSEPATRRSSRAPEGSPRP